ncbi:hypothetical protein OIU34_21090 [Pararhizobium sp. BT-229]|uniref:hypothetical protein n=1 Tax=Pararhizobium sp. BT-229 TaxID=2986923 RepID=UPI0021F7B1E6|nr:hypothetical protein [Pararhizobium sp. BT-229]MCV9964387.1 hypothetical protein [Pararhizobium sp. BT-229]
MRSFLVGTFIALAASVSLASNALALSVLQTSENAPQQQEAQSTTPSDNDHTYLDKTSLSAVTEAMRLNREHRRMFADLTKESGRNDNALTKYIKALDVRYAILSAVGDSLVKATTQDEVTEASAAANAVLDVRTELDRAVGATQMAIIDAARMTKGYFGACDSRGELADGTKCVRVKDKAAEAHDSHPFWAQPWDAGRFVPAPSQEPGR